MDVNGEKHIVAFSDFFNTIIEKQKNIPIIKIYSKNYDCPDNTGRYSIDTEFYILFQNQYALIIDYRNIDSLYIQYKEMNEEELKEAAKINCNDFFNRIDEVCDSRTWKLLRRQISIFEYGCIKDIKYDIVKTKYEVWENSSIKEIILILDNENEIHIYPEPALSDGYVDIWCKGSKMVKQKLKEQKEINEMQ